jgi:glucose/arabinose dehydrogenase
MLLLLVGGCMDSQEASAPRQHRQRVELLPRFSVAPVVEGLSRATAMAFAPDGRLFVCEQDGRLRVVESGRLLPEPFLTVEVDGTGERGLLGVAFDPDFASQPYVYVYYTATEPQEHNRLSRFLAEGNRAVPGSEQVLLELDELGRSNNHNGGALAFGADGRLYVAVGENARPQEAQELSSLLGKVLRLEKNGSIPPDNPFYGQAQGLYRAIFALGLRNPFSFAIQPGTGRILINDVGQERWEELNEGAPGANYGWPHVEGPSSDSRFRAPLYAYEHDSGEVYGCAIAGGTFYNPSTRQFPAEWEGAYFFADYCRGWIRALDVEAGTTRPFAEDFDALVALAVGPEGALYALDRDEGTVYRIGYTAPGDPPAIARHPATQRIAAGQSVTFSVEAHGEPPLSYQWQRHGVDLPGQTAAQLVLEAVGEQEDGARFRAGVSNAHGTVWSNEAVLTVVAGRPPRAEILSPGGGMLYSAGESFTFQGSGMDEEDGALPVEALTWRVDFHHEDHQHPFVPPTAGVASGTFTIPAEGEVSADVWYRVYLEVRDSSGLSHATYRDVLPRKARLRLETVPPGLRVTLDGQPLATPVEVESVVGVLRTLGVVSPQEAEGQVHAFGRWEHGGAAEQQLATPAEGAVYRAEFQPAQAGLRAEYFDQADLSDLKLERVDATVDFHWGTGSPDPAMAPDTFSVRWTGSVVPEHSETYTFYTQSNDGVRLWVDGVLVIDNWTVHGTIEDSARVALEGGRAYSLRMEFFESKGVATARLLWASPSQPKQVIPAGRLRPALPEGGLNP